MKSRSALEKRITKLEQLAKPRRPKIDCSWAREILNARLDRIRENDPERYNEVMAKIQARVAEMRAESSYG